MESGFSVWSLGFSVWGLEFGVQDFVFGVLGLGIRELRTGLGFGV